MSSAPPSESDAAGIATLLQRIGRLRASHAVLLQQLESRFPAYAQLIRPKPITLTEARATLRPGEVLVAIYVAFDRTNVWAVPPGWTNADRRGSVVGASDSGHGGQQLAG